VPPEYDETRAAYSFTHQPDPDIVAAIELALGDARTVASVGSYASPQREVVAMEPSERLPLEDDSVDAALAVLTADRPQLLAEMVRVARKRVVVFAYDPGQAAALWLVRDYLPAIAALDERRFLSMDELAAALGGDVRVERVPIPHDCRDGILGAFWRRPERYLEPALLPGNAALSGLPPEVVDAGLERLRNDLDSGAWRRRYGGLLSREELDVGYRLVVAEL
jgi:hypothetical protein